MASTIFNQARVWSRMTASGDVVYLWEENTHCIKDGPKQASWCFMKFGRKAEIIERIYRCAESIPGGMLKCGTSPERFIENMLKLLDNPLESTKWLSFMPSLAAQEFIRLAKESVLPARCSAMATQASLPDWMMMPLFRSSTETCLPTSINILEESV